MLFNLSVYNVYVSGQVGIILLYSKNTGATSMFFRSYYVIPKTYFMLLYNTIFHYFTANAISAW